jgi:hypothetical protein
MDGINRTIPIISFFFHYFNSQSNASFFSVNISYIAPLFLAKRLKKEKSFKEVKK